jgi:hypothetical protein
MFTLQQVRIFIPSIVLIYEIIWETLDCYPFLLSADWDQSSSLSTSSKYMLSSNPVFYLTAFDPSSTSTTSTITSAFSSLGEYPKAILTNYTHSYSLAFSKYVSGLHGTAISHRFFFVRQLDGV